MHTIGYKMLSRKARRKKNLLSHGTTQPLEIGLTQQFEPAIPYILHSAERDRADHRLATIPLSNADRHNELMATET